MRATTYDTSAADPPCAADLATLAVPTVATIGRPHSDQEFSDTMNDAYAFLEKGGLVMIPILLCSLVALTLFLERLWALQRDKVLPARFVKMLRHALRERQWARARSLCAGNESSISRLTRSALRYADRPRTVVRDALQEAGRREATYLERFVGAIGAVASVAPLIGLLGTVIGMIRVFNRVASEFDQGGELNPGVLANGIWEALITTAAGLTVAIPAFLAFRYLMSRIDGFVGELEGHASEMVDLLADEETGAPPLPPDDDDFESAPTAADTATADDHAERVAAGEPA